MWWACIDSHVLEFVEAGGRGVKRTCDMSCLDDGTRLVLGFHGSEHEDVFFCGREGRLCR